MSTSPKRLAALASAALAVAGFTVLAPTASQANPAGTDLVISEVYGAAAATPEPPSTPTSSSSTTAAARGRPLRQVRPLPVRDRPSAQAPNLTGSIALPGAYYLVQEGRGANGGSLPTPDAPAPP